jgi:hypothetical protein
VHPSKGFVVVMSAANPYDKIALLQEYSVDLVATLLVTIILVLIAYGVTNAWVPKEEKNGKKDKKKKKKDDEAEVDLLTEYGRAWCLHQFVPFVDKLILGSYGQAMDNRMLKPWDQGPDDWMIRLPILVLSFIFPTPLLLAVAHIANVVSWWYWMPAVWDHMVWAAGASAWRSGSFLPCASS